MGAGGIALSQGKEGLTGLLEGTAKKPSPTSSSLSCTARPRHAAAHIPAGSPLIHTLVASQQQNTEPHEEDVGDTPQRNPMLMYLMSG